MVEEKDILKQLQQLQKSLEIRFDDQQEKLVRQSLALNHLVMILGAQQEAMAQLLLEVCDILTHRDPDDLKREYKERVAEYMKANKKTHDHVVEYLMKAFKK